jgi:hypothetical protein
MKKVNCKKSNPLIKKNEIKGLGWRLDRELSTQKLSVKKRDKPALRASSHNNRV